jgi:hypothetical protein
MSGRPSAFAHFTHPDNVASIIETGIGIGREPDGSRGLEWVLAFYEENPAYLTLEASDFIEVYRAGDWAGYACFDVDVSGLPLVADIPSLVDKGARYDSGLLYLKRSQALEPLLRFADENGWIEIEHLVNPGSDAAAAAIKVTGTAACVASIPPDRIRLREQAAVPRPQDTQRLRM